jgi:signal transduction histidine kinase
MRRPRLGARLTGRWRTLPRRTIRLRLTAIYTGLFLACGAALLAINYGLVSAQLTSNYFASLSVEVGHEQLVISQQISVRPASGSGTASGGSAGGRVTGPSGSGPSPTRIAANGSQTGIRLPSPAVVRASAVAASNGAHDALLIKSGIALAIMALLASALGWVVAGRALRPLRAITAAAREISASSLHRRLAIAGPDDELRQLGHTFDALLERLDTAFTAQRQFAANVSHELRTPLTYERALIEVALGDPGASSDHLRAVLRQLLVAGEHQERLIEALLVLSRSQRGLEHREAVDLAAVVAHTLDRLDISRLTVERSLAPAVTDGDPRLIERLVSNLIANAIEHNQPAGRIDVTTATANDRALLRVTNSGPRIAPEDLSRLFEPFQRLDGVRTSTINGVGLGLSIVKAIADAHAATITTSLLEQGGLSIEITFPAWQGTRSPSAPAR